MNNMACGGDPRQLVAFRDGVLKAMGADNKPLTLHSVRERDGGMEKVEYIDENNNGKLDTGEIKLTYFFGTNPDKKLYTELDIGKYGTDKWVEILKQGSVMEYIYQDYSNDGYTFKKSGRLNFSTNVPLEKIKKTGDVMIKEIDRFFQEEKLKKKERIRKEKNTIRA